MENKKHKHRIEFLILVILLLLLWYMGRRLPIDTYALERSLKDFPLLYAAALYILLYVIITFFIFFSKDIFWVAGAVAFGPYLSTLLVFIAEVINAFILFHLARSLGRNFVAHYAKGKFGNLDERLGNINFFWLFIIRLVPLIAYRFQDLGFGLTRIHFKRYLAAVLLATPLRVLWVQYILAAIGKNIFVNPELLTAYLLENRVLFAASFVYLILIVAVFLKLKRKG